MNNPTLPRKHACEAVFACVLSIAFPLALALAANPAPAFAQPLKAAHSPSLSTQANRIADSGRWGTCTWNLTEAGTITVYPGKAGTPRSAITGSAPDMMFVREVNNVPWAVHRDVKKVVFKQQKRAKTVLPANCRALFANLPKLTAVDFSGADLSKVRDLSYAFYGCTALKSFSFAPFKAARPTNLAHIFDGCTRLWQVSANGLDTAEVTDLSYAFELCAKLTSADLSTWNTARVVHMDGMFLQCSKLERVNVGNWNTAHVRGMNAMFYRCSSLTALDVSRWNTARLTDMDHLFGTCCALKSLDVSRWNTAKATSMAALFENCASLESLAVANWNTANVRTMFSLFRSCSSLTSLDLSKWRTSQVSNMWGMFHGCGALKSLNLAGLDTAKARTTQQLDYLFYGCDKLAKVTLGQRFRFGNVSSYLPTSNVNGHMSWYSAQAKRYFSSKQVATARAGKADTYTK